MCNEKRGRGLRRGSLWRVSYMVGRYLGQRAAIWTSLLSRKQRSQSLTHHLFSLKGGVFEEGTHCLIGGTAIEILMVTEAQGVSMIL